MSVEMVRPDGPVVRPAVNAAPRRARSAGTHIEVLTNNKPNAPELLGSIADAVAERTGGTVRRHVPKNAATPMDPQVLDGMTPEASVVLTGAGD